VLCALQQTDECNLEFEAKLSRKREKMRQQQRHLEALQLNIVRLNQHLETATSRGFNAAAAFGVVRQNANYRSLPPGASSKSVIHHSAQQSGRRPSAQHCKDTQQFDILTCKNDADSRKGIYAADSSHSVSDGNSINFSLTASGELTSYTSVPVTSAHWRHPAGVSHSENLRRTSHRLIGQFALQQTDSLHQSEHLVDTAKADHNTSSLSLGQRSADSSMTMESLQVRPPFTVNEPQELEQRLQSKDVSPSSQPKMDEVCLVSSDVSSRPRKSADESSDLVVLPDVIDSTGAASTLSVSSTSKVPPPVPQKSQFQHASSSGCGVRSCDAVAVRTQPIVLTADSNSPLNTSTNSTSDSALPCDAGFSFGRDLLTEKLELSDEIPLSKSRDLSPKETLSDDDVRDSADTSRAVDRPVYKPSVTCPVRRRLSAREEPQFTSSTSTSGDMYGKTDTASAVEDSSVSSERNLSKVQTVKKKLRASMSRKVQFEPLALLLDAALEGEMDLLQTTLKVRTFFGFSCTAF